MHKYAAVTALAVALITINAPAVSALGFPLHEVDCDNLRRVCVDMLSVVIAASSAIGSTPAIL
jgi:hypothetical protein